MKYKSFNLIDKSNNGGLFKLKVGGDRSNLIDDENSKRKVRVVSNISGNNGIESHIYNDDIGIKNCITIATRGNDYFSCYQDDYTVTIVRALLLYSEKFKLNKYRAFYICALLRMNTYKCAYGRVISGERLETEKITLPIDSNEKIDWKYIEDIVSKIYLNIEKKISKNELINKKIDLDYKNWRKFKIRDLFPKIISSKGSQTNELIPGNEIPYVAAKKESNGLDMICARKGNENFISQGNCIVFIQLGEGSAGYTTYQEKDFIGMSGKTSCGYNKNLNKYNALFIVSILDLERPKYSFGRSWTGNRLFSTTIKLPSNKKNEPDWDFMENYIKSLKFSSSI